MKILYHHRTLGDGAEGIHVREMVRAFRALGHEVKVIGPVGETPPEASKRFRFLDRIKRAVPAFVYELLEMGYTAYSYLLVRHQVRCFRPDFIYDRYITFNAGVVLAARRAGVPVCLEVNAPLALERSGEQDERLTFKRIAARMERWICSNATHTIVVSTPLKTYLESVGVPAGKCVVMPNGADPDKFRERPKSEGLVRSLGIPPDAFVVGFTGVLRPWHGLDLLIRAVARFNRDAPDVRVLVVGDGPYRPALEQIAREEGVAEQLIVTGRIPHDSVPEYVALFDVAVSPKATFYASPMKVIEYMGLGKAVVVPNPPNFLDIVDEDSSGITFRDGDAGDLARALRELYVNRDRCTRLGRGARKKVEDRLNWQWNAREVCRLVQAP